MEFFFAIHLHNEQETKEFLEELAKQQGEELSGEFFNKWITFETYRKIVFQ